MPDILYAPNQEHIVTTNVWAFLHWLRVTHGIDLAGWAALQRWSVDDRAAFARSIGAFARLPDGPLLLARHQGEREALVLRRAEGQRIALSWDDLLDPLPNTPLRGGAELPLPRSGGGSGRGTIPAAITIPLTRLWSPAELARPLVDTLLHADLRPDDRVVIANSSAWPWLAALLEGTTVILAAATPATLLATAAEEHASVLVAPAQALAEAAFHRARHRPHLAALRTIIATGGPLSPEGRTRIYTWIKSDLMLLARTGDTMWGNPLEPVCARPAASPGFVTPPTAIPVPR